MKFPWTGRIGYQHYPECRIICTYPYTLKLHALSSKKILALNIFRLYNRNKPSAEIAGGLHVYKKYTIPYRSFGHGHFRSK